jgi:NAD(P)-dependent dehydrogenase (short-subunit alcohol dehydrogenase family)
MNRLEGRTAIVTGASRGIGAAIADRLRAEGASLVLVSRTAGADARAARPDASVKVVPGDVADPATAERALVAAAEFGGVDILVNNAGLDLVEDLLSTDVERCREIFDTNFFGAMWMLQRVGRELRDSGRAGSIINVTSRLASIGVPRMNVYGASKGALLTLTRGAAVELAPYGIRVNAVAPGMTATPMFEEYLAAQPDGEEIRNRVRAAIPQGRLAQPEDVAAAVAYLASEDSAHVTGASIPVDGGYTAA